jgi:protein-tyrosine phosphatase
MSEFLTVRKMPYIPDPYYMGVEGFSLVLDLLEDSCKNLYDIIVKAEFGA